jgi:hypothetical protein
VGFVCPVPGCNKPYLEWHHFDPPWHVQQHHNTKGMIALCREHHIQADHGAFTKEQFRKLKKHGNENWKAIKGEFNWLRNKLLVYVAGNFYYNTDIPIEFNGEPLIWFNRNKEGYLLLNLNMLTASGRPRAYLRDNEWFNTGHAEDIECPPSAKRLEIQYENGDRLKIEYIELLSLDEAHSKYSKDIIGFSEVVFPVTAVEVSIDVANTDLHIVPSKALFGSNMTGCFAVNCRVGLALS